MPSVRLLLVVKVAGLTDLCDRLRNSAPGALIGLEGFSGSGKTAIADEISRVIPMTVIHTDHFATKFEDPPPYAKCLDVDRLRRAIDERDMSIPCRVEGICLRDVLTLVGGTPTLFVYIKRVGENGLWYDGLELEDAADDSRHVAHEPHRSDIEYHARVRPHELADLLHERVEET